jgi:hypothetical protein
MDGPCCTCREWTRSCELFVYSSYCENCQVQRWINSGLIRQPNGKDGSLEHLDCNPNRPWPIRLPRRVKVKARR